MRGNPRIQLRLKPENIRWLKDYAKQNNTTMSEILREHIESLRSKQQDEKERDK